MTADEIECIEEGGTEPTIALLPRLAAAMDAGVRLTARHNLGSVWFEPHAAWALALHEGTLVAEMSFLAVCAPHAPDVRSGHIPGLAS